MIFRVQQFIQRKSPFLNRMDWAIIYFVALIGGAALAVTLMRCIGRV